MRIQSQFKDYYDSMQKFASFDVLPYRRNVLVEESDFILKKKQYIRPQKFAIGFCGKIYYGLHHETTEEQREKYPSVYSENNFSVYSYEDLKNYDRTARYDARETIRKYNEYFEVVEDNSIFIEKNTPIFIASNEFAYGPWICYHTMSKPKNANPKEYPILDFTPTLEMYHFEKMFTKELAYMNIESYINGVLAAEHKQVPEMENGVKITSHGFDKKSFRN
jgi:hypothetical protein